MDSFLDFSDDLNSLEVDLYESIGSGNPSSKVLARVQGQFFVPDGASRNKRWYSESFWRDVLGRDEVTRSLNDGMLGTLLHPSNDKLAHPMYASHVTKKLWVDNHKKGMGEAYILNTPVGRVVDTFQQSKLVKLYTSSRAYGKYVEGKKHEGMPVVDSKNYFLKTFDFVLDPGFIEALPGYSSSPEGKGVITAFEALSECFLGNMDEFNMPKVEKERRAKLLVRDMDILLRSVK